MSTSSKQQKIKNFDPSGVGDTGKQIFGLPFNFEEAEITLLPVPWEVTVSYKEGTVHGPQAILDASSQLDLEDPDFENAWQRGIYMMEISEEWLDRSETLRPKAYELIRYQEKGGNIKENASLNKSLASINEAARELNQWVFEQTTKLLQHGKLVGLIGGEHSIPLGFLKALANKHETFGILQIDAHFDLREAYEGFTYSHASIMYNALPIENMSKLVPVGIRDYAASETAIAKRSDGRIQPFTDQAIRHRQYAGESWKAICDDIISTLPEKVYITFDIDGLDPKLCPNTGTPVAGGFEMQEIFFLLKMLVNSGRTIIGFDLVEVSPGEDDWDGNVGARILYKLCNMMAKSNGR